MTVSANQMYGARLEPGAATAPVSPGGHYPGGPGKHRGRHASCYPSVPGRHRRAEEDVQDRTILAWLEAASC